MHTYKMQEKMLNIFTLLVIRNNRYLKALDTRKTSIINFYYYNYITKIIINKKTRNQNVKLC